MSHYDRKNEVEVIDLLKEFTFRFFDEKHHKKGVIENITALDFLQATEFSFEIAVQLGNSDNDWDKETTHYEPIK